MAVVVNGDGSITGLSVGGLPDGTVDEGTLASSAVTEAKLATDSVTAAKIPDTVEAGFKSGRKNLIINGGMAVAQRGTSTTSGAQVYLLDRFYTYSFAATGRTVSQSTDAPDEFSHSLKVQRDSGNTATTDVYLSQPIETKNCVGTAGKKVTLSFWAKKGANWSKSGGAIGVSLTSGTGTDQSLMSGLTGSTSVINTSQALTTSWVKYSFTSSAVVPTDSTQLVYQSVNGWTGTAGADDSFYITGIQLEVGETATDFEHRSYGEELALCKRYYTVFKDGMGYFAGNGVGSARIDVGFPLSVPLRASPTIENTGVRMHRSGNESATANQVSVAEYDANGSAIKLKCQGFSVSDETAYTVRVNVADLILDSEL